ncbi:mannose-6-phosphate isomerase, class I [Flavisolibacter tropicus]|uniref:mannose-6-phosphate isomerase n=1 Tax=Flavisolibacter tropicus TaxID=1492898 RepID=A0A172U1B7_9BACT|nr:mannose-6-phosphate isomerase, class I [Flavisolibacter tropicus]ANE52914.1 mannose-6-phosphate isomerase [Flavisolibacter tropicus]
MQRIFKLEGKVQQYAWGGYDYLPQLLNQENNEAKPFAEYWLGAHPNHPSKVLVSTPTEAVGVTTENLDAFIQQDATNVLGVPVEERFHALPYLLKVLDVRQMLSIQVHPSKVEAEKGFLLENEADIPVTASNRNYKDDNHKPELMVALGSFWLLHGFKPEAELKQVIDRTPELQSLAPVFEKEGYKGLYEKVMTLPQVEVNARLEPLAKRVVPLYEAGKLAKSSEDFWAARAIQSFCKDGQYDRGIFSVYFFNLLNLQKGEGIFQPAGMPHAYLEGQNVEIMANSDNVLRAGLTDKYIDVPELLKHTEFVGTVPQIIKASGSETFYEAPVPEFGIYQYEVEAGYLKTLLTDSAEIFLCLEGEVSLTAAGASLSIRKGEAAFVCAQTEVELQSGAGGKVYRATAGCV